MATQVISKYCDESVLNQSTLQGRLSSQSWDSLSWKLPDKLVSKSDMGCMHSTRRNDEKEPVETREGLGPRGLNERGKERDTWPDRFKPQPSYPWSKQAQANWKHLKLRLGTKLFAGMLLITSVSCTPWLLNWNTVPDDVITGRPSLCPAS